MTTSNTNNNQGGFGKLALDLLFTWLIPNQILAERLFGQNFGFRDLLGLKDGKEAIVRTFIVAALVPIAYTAFDLLRNRRFNPVTVVAGSSAVVGGALAILQYFVTLEGAAYALKDSYGSIVLAAIMGVSLLLGKPFFEFFIETFLTPKNPNQQALMKQTLRTPKLAQGLRIATTIILLEAVLMGALNFVVNYRVVLGKFGTQDFNNQVIQANNIMRLPSILTSLVAFGLAFYLVSKASEKIVPGTSLLDDGFLDKLEAAHTAQTPA